MKLYLPNLSCGVCSKDILPAGKFLILEITDANYYQATCGEGHVSTISMQSRKFEILFEMGAVALLEGYHREAVANIAGSLERFLEFYIDVMLLEDGIDESEFKASWKLVSGQSERQLGAFIFIYLSKNQHAVKYISNDAIKFRNTVIHKGYIPTYDEVSKYGQSVLAFIDPIFEDLKDNHVDSVHKLIRRDYSKFPSLTNTVGLETIITNAHSKYFTGQRSFIEEITRLRQRINNQEERWYGVRGVQVFPELSTKLSDPIP